jgi:hypothetical protein
VCFSDRHDFVFAENPFLWKYSTIDLCSILSLEVETYGHRYIDGRTAFNGIRALFRGFSFQV